MVRIGKTRFYDNKIFILDRNNGKGVLVFDMFGKFLYSIGNPGHGPAEFVSLWSFTINEYTNQVILLDTEGRKLLYFTPDGNFISEKRLKYFYSSIEMLGENNMAAITVGIESDYLLHLLNANVNECEEMFAHKPYNLVIGSNQFTVYEDKLLYLQSYNDTVYHINPEGAQVHTIIDYGKHRVTENKLEEVPFGPISTWRSKAGCMSYTSNYTETSDHIYFTFAYDKQDSPYYVLYNKKNKKSTIYTNSAFNDISFCPYAPRINGVNSQNEYIAEMDTYILLESYNAAKAKYNTWDEDTRKRYDDMQDFINTLEKDSNPVLMLLKFK